MDGITRSHCVDVALCYARQTWPGLCVCVSGRRVDCAKTVELISGGQTRLSAQETALC